MFEAYLAELKKIKLLSLDEETLLWQDYKEANSLESRRKLIENYQPLVFKTAMNYHINYGILMDLVQEGTVGLIEAVEGYNHLRGVAFSLYAYHRIRGRMVNYLTKEGKQALVYMDTPIEVSEANFKTLGETLIDRSPAVADQAELSYLIGEVKLALSRLPVKEQAVLSGVYLEEQEPKAVAKDLNISLAHFYKLQKQGVRRIRGMMSRLMHELKG